MDLSPRTETFQQEDHSWLGSATGLSDAQSCTIRLASLTSGTHYPNGYIPSGTALARYTSGTYEGLYAPVAATSDEVQTVTVDATGGTFTLTFDGETTSAIAENAAASAVQTALLALPNLNTGDVVVTGDAGGPYTVTFGGRYAGVNVPALTASATSLTGGAGTVTIATGTGGGTAATEGTDVLAGFLAHSIPVATGSTANPVGALMWHGRIKEANLPIAVSANQKATNTQFSYVP